MLEKELRTPGFGSRRNERMELPFTEVGRLEEKQDWAEKFKMPISHFTQAEFVDL